MSFVGRSASSLIGKKFNRWTILKLISGTKTIPRKALCKCDCGTKAIHNLSTIVDNRSNSCGCYRSEVTSLRSTKHGMCNSPEYISWLAMKQRCSYRKGWNFKYYGKLGVTIDKRWNEFAVFFADMGSKPTPEHTLDRIDPHGNYGPSNCRWATKKEQALNTRKRANRGQN